MHDVKLHDFRISRYEITNQQYCDFLNDDDSAVAKVKAGEWIDCDNEYCDIKLIEDRFVVKSIDRRDYPVVMVDWHGAAAFANYLNRHTGYTPFFDRKSGTREVTAKGYRLPTEAEWEYACRAGTVTPFNTGENLTTEQANYDGDYPYKDFPKGKYLGTTTPVGNYPPNAWGLYDMHGNVWEWCADWYGENYYEVCKDSGIVTNPTGPEVGSSRVLRGGGWYNYAQFCRSAYRSHSDPGYRFDGIGFRLVFVP